MGAEVILGLMGGLGLFLYGMKQMSDGLEKAAGARMRSVLEFFTANRLAGTLVGILFTAIIQSSSATTVMVVSFVNSGLMNLMQAAGVIMGANIGTTVTSQLISLNLSELAPVFIMIGVIMAMFCKKNKVRQAGEVILGFGILFMGLAVMSGSMSTLKDSPQVVEMMESLTNPFLALLVGFAVTAVLQSSSATVGIVLLLATQGLLELGICFFIILGCNIGSCVSALLASISGKKNAKRAAMIHFLFNIFGSAFIAVCLLVGMEPITRFIAWISGGNPAREVANAHTLFKVVEVVVLFPVIQWIVKLTYILIPEGKKEKALAGEGELEFIGEQSLLSPTTAVFDATRELERMGQIAVRNMERAMNALVTEEEEEIREVYAVEKKIDHLNHVITDYLIRLNQTTLPVDDARNIGGLFHVVNDIERIGDHAENIADSARIKKERHLDFSQTAKKELSTLLDMVIKITTYSLDMFSNNNQKHMQEILQLENRIDILEREFQENHVQRLANNACSPEAGMIYSDILSGLERVADHATNIAFSLQENDPDEEQKTVLQPE